MLHCLSFMHCYNRYFFLFAGARTYSSVSTASSTPFIYMFIKKLIFEMAEVLVAAEGLWARPSRGSPRSALLMAMGAEHPPGGSALVDRFRSGIYLFWLKIPRESGET
uniref:Secreted protein n=1 Tax=Globodera rostochiensis TaxID=31243 RepID=A0A914GVL2_GLORO